MSYGQFRVCEDVRTDPSYDGWECKRCNQRFTTNECRTGRAQCPKDNAQSEPDTVKAA